MKQRSTPAPLCQKAQCSDGEWVDSEKRITVIWSDCVCIIVSHMLMHTIIITTQASHGASVINGLFQKIQLTPPSTPSNHIDCSGAVNYRVIKWWKERTRDHRVWFFFCFFFCFHFYLLQFHICSAFLSALCLNVCCTTVSYCEAVQFYMLYILTLCPFPLAQMSLDTDDKRACTRSKAGKSKFVCLFLAFFFCLSV